MRKKKADARRQTEEKVLDVSASMQGTLRFNDPVNLRINGKFEGTLDTKGALMVGQGADIKANITGEDISIAGYVKGNIIATKSLKLEAGARLNGDIDTPKLSVSEGAVLNGRLRMAQAGASGGAATGERMTQGQLAQYLEVDEAKVNEWLNSGMLPGHNESGEMLFERSEVDRWITSGKVKA